MKKQLSKIIAMTLVCAMTLPSAVFASSGVGSLSGNTPGPAVSSNSANISGNGVVDTSTYNVLIPSSLDFAIDRFEVSDEGQIYGVDYPIINASQFPVRVDITVTASGNNAKFVAEDSEDLASTSANHAIYMAAYVPSEVIVDSVSVADISNNTISGNYAAVSDNVVIPLSASENATFAFKLDKLADVSTSNLSQNNGATFTWVGSVNTYTEWADGDATVDAVFTLAGLSKAAYNAVESNSGNNYVSAGGQTRTVSKASPSAVTYTLPKAAKSVSLLSTKSGSSSIGLGAAGNLYAISGTTLTLKSGIASASTVPVGTYKVIVTYTDNTTSDDDFMYVVRN